MDQPKKPVYVIYFNRKRYLDFPTLLYLYNDPGNSENKRSSLFRYLKKSSIKSKKILNRHIYSLDDILSDILLLESMKNITMILSQLEDN
jgi:hypothetical protein